MVVTDRAAGRQPEPNLRGCFRSVAVVEHPILFIDRSTFASGDVAAIEARGNLLFERAAGKQVARQLLDRKRSNGMLAFNAWITQLRYDQISR